MAVAGTLEIQLLANMARLQADMTTAKNVVGAAAADMSKAIASVQSAAAALGLGLSVGALVLFAKHVVDATARFKDLGQEAGTTAAAISRFEAPARMAGLGLDAVSGAIFKMSKAALEAKEPTSKAAQALNAIGISTAQLKGLKSDEMFELVARALGNYGDGLQKNAVMQELFGKSGKEMNKVVAEIAATGKLHASVTDEEAEAADRLGDQIVELQLNSEKLWRSMAGPGVSALNDIMRAFIDARKEGNLFEGLVAGLSAAMDKMFGKTVQLQILETDRAIAEQIERMKNLAGNVERYRAAMGDARVAQMVQDQTRVLNELLQKQLGLREQLRRESEKPPPPPPPKPPPDFDPAARAAALAAAKKAEAEAIRAAKEQLEAYVKAADKAREMDEETAKQIADLDKKRTDAILGAEKTIAQIEFETTALRMSSDEREIAIALRALETSGINKQDAAYEGLAGRIRAAIETQQGVRAEINASVEAQRNSASAWEDLADRVIHGFKDMRAALKSFVQDLLMMFAKRYFLQIVAGVSGGGLGAATGQGTGAGSLLSAGGSILSMAGNSIFGGSAFGAALGSSLPASMATLGTAFSGGAAAVGGFGAVAGAALNLVPVIGSVIYAMYALYEAFKDTGENWRAQLGFGANAQAYTTQGVFGPEGFLSIQGQDALNRQIQAFMASTGAVDTLIAGTLSAATIATITRNLGGAYATRNDGQPAQFAFGAGDETAGQQLTLEYLQKKYGTIFDEIDHTFADWIRSYTGDSGQLLAAIGDFAAVMNALQDSPVPGLDLESLRALQREGEKLSDTFNRVTGAWSTYVSLFYSAEEQHTMGMDLLQKQFEALGLVMPTTREGFRTLVESLEQGSPLWLAVVGMAQSFSDLVPAVNAATDAIMTAEENFFATARAAGFATSWGGTAYGGSSGSSSGGSDIPYGGMYGPGGSAYGGGGGYGPGPGGGSAPGLSALESAMQSLQQYLTGLNSNPSLSPLDPRGQLDSATGTFWADLALARAGDAAAAARIQGDLQNALTLGRGFYASSGGYVDFFNSLTGAAGQFASGGQGSPAEGPIGPLLPIATQQVELAQQGNSTLSDIRELLYEIAHGGQGLTPGSGAVEMERR